MHVVQLNYVKPDDTTKPLKAISSIPEELAVRLYFLCCIRFFPFDKMPALLLLPFTYLSHLPQNAKNYEIDSSSNISRGGDGGGGGSSGR